MAGVAIVTGAASGIGAALGRALVGHGAKVVVAEVENPRNSGQCTGNASSTSTRGVLHGCQAAYPIMKSAGRGHIVNTAALAGLVPASGRLTPYVMTRYGVVGLSLGLRAVTLTRQERQASERTLADTGAAEVRTS